MRTTAPESSCWNETGFSRATHSTPSDTNSGSYLFCESYCATTPRLMGASAPSQTTSPFLRPTMVRGEVVMVTELPSSSSKTTSGGMGNSPRSSVLSSLKVSATDWMSKTGGRSGPGLSVRSPEQVAKARQEAAVNAMARQRKGLIFVPLFRRLLRGPDADVPPRSIRPRRWGRSEPGRTA